MAKEKATPVAEDKAPLDATHKFRINSADLKACKAAAKSAGVKDFSSWVRDTLIAAATSASIAKLSRRPKSKRASRAK